MIRKLFLILSIPCFLISNAYAQESVTKFPPQSTMSFLGLDDTSSPTIVKDGRAADIQNVIIDNTGSAAKRNGYSVLGAILDTNDLADDFEAVNGIYELYKSDGIRYFFAACGSKLFRYNSGNWTDITGGLSIAESQNYQWQFLSALDYAIGTNNYNAPVKFTSTGVATQVDFSSLTYPVTRAKCMIWWKNYLVVANTIENSVSHTTRIRWSNVGTIETWDDDDYVDIATLGGQQIEGMQLLYDDLYIFLTDSIYKVSLVGGEDLIVVTRVSEGVGAIARDSIQTLALGNMEGIVFLSRDKTINFCDGVRVSEISSLIENTMDDLSQARLQYAVGVNDRARARYYLAVTTGTGSTNNLLLDYHYGIGEWSKHTGINANSLTYAVDSNGVSRVYAGNYDSFVYELFDENLDSDVAGETGIFDAKSIIDTPTASGCVVYYDTSADFTDVTGATVTITSGDGNGEESVIAATTASGIVVTNSALTANATSGYSIGAIEAYITTKWYDMGDTAKRKNFQELYLWTSTSTSATMQIYHATDFNSEIAVTDVNLTADGSLWGTAIWGNSTWGGSNLSLTKVPINTQGRFLKLRFSESSIDEPMQLYSYDILSQHLDYR